ncbi:hypothetical protein COB28_02035 [Candidatus Dependentiae bacterium]|nr:MAG: hypothetical protein COB28_02035 [Candidatus Dependentiae bacterium]
MKKVLYGITCLMFLLSIEQAMGAKEYDEYHKIRKERIRGDSSRRPMTRKGKTEDLVGQDAEKDEDPLAFPARLNLDILDSQEFLDLSEKDQEEIAKELFDEFNEWAEEEGYGSELEEMDEEFFAPGEFDEDIDELLEVDTKEDLDYSDEKISDEMVQSVLKKLEKKKSEKQERSSRRNLSDDEVENEREAGSIDDFEMIKEDYRKMQSIDDFDTAKKKPAKKEDLEFNAGAKSLDEDTVFDGVSQTRVVTSRRASRRESLRGHAGKRRVRTRVGLPEEARTRGFRNSSSRSAIEKKAPSSHTRRRVYGGRTGLARRENLVRRSQSMANRERRSAKGEVSSRYQSPSSGRRQEMIEEQGAIKDQKIREKRRIKSPALSARERYLIQQKN